jgi:hypothetical protein
VETGVAVVAELPELPGLGTRDSGLGAASSADGSGNGAGDAEARSLESVPDAYASGADAADVSDGVPHLDAGSADAAGELQAEVESAQGWQSDGAPDTPSPTARVVEGPLDAGLPGPDVPSPDVPMIRFTVHTARYRLTLKGPDRGKWEVDVVAEADAPLDAVDAVVRGVQRRAGEAADPERLTGDAFRAALAEPAWMLTR